MYGGEKYNIRYLIFPIYGFRETITKTVYILCIYTHKACYLSEIGFHPWVILGGLLGDPLGSIRGGYGEDTEKVVVKNTEHRIQDDEMAKDKSPKWSKMSKK